MYLVRETNMDKVIRHFDEKVDAEIYVEEQAKDDLNTYKSEWDDNAELDDFKRDYAIEEVTFKIGYEDTEICHDSSDVLLAVKQAHNKALSDYSVSDATDHIVFEISGTYSEINGSYDIYEVGENGEIIQSNLPDCIGDIFYF